MIDKITQEHFENEFKSQKGQNYPCSNQIVHNFIITHKNDEYAQNFIKSLNGKYIQNSLLGVKEILLPSGEHFNIIAENPNLRGYRFYKVYIDHRIDEKSLSSWIVPCCALYCCMLKFF